MSVTNDMGRIEKFNSVFAESILLSQLESAIFSIKVKRLAGFLKPAKQDINLVNLGIHISEINQDYEDVRTCIADLGKLGVVIPGELTELIATLYEGDIGSIEEWKDIAKRVDQAYRQNVIQPSTKVH